jgi:hypothetical protein
MGVNIESDNFTHKHTHKHTHTINHTHTKKERKEIPVTSTIEVYDE